MQHSNQDIVIEYRTLPASIGLFVLLFTSPAWLILSLLIGGLMTVFGVCSLEIQTLAGGLVLLCLSALGSGATIALSDTRVVLSKTGIQVPLLLLLPLRGRRARRWSDLQRAELQEYKEKDRKCSVRLKLSFYSGGSVNLRFKSLKKEQLEQVLLALDIWAPQCIRNAALIEKQHELTKEGGGTKQTFTQLWEEELRRRFSPTTFVPLEAGTRLQDGRLLIVRQLAFGGLSALYLAQLNNQDMVVLKEAVIPATVQDSARAKALEMFDREAKLLCKLSHESISKVVDNFVENDRHYIVLEYVCGQDLRQYVIENGAVPESKVMLWAHEIASILKYLHGQTPPVIHRDLTPENLVLDRHGKIMLIDFGAANEFLGTATGTVVGKQAYISPEQFRGKPCPQTDIYALGATMYFLLTGKEPEPLTKLQLPVEAAFTARAREIIGKCTDLSLEHRFQSADEVLAALSGAPCQTAARATTYTCAATPGAAPPDNASGAN